MAARERGATSRELHRAYACTVTDLGGFVRDRGSVVVWSARHRPGPDAGKGMLLPRTLKPEFDKIVGALITDFSQPKALQSPTRACRPAVQYRPVVVITKGPVLK